MGGVHGGGAGHGCESQCEQYLAGADEWGRGVSIDAEREGFVAGVVAGWKDDRVYIGTGRRIASLFAVNGRRRAATADEPVHGSRFSEVVAGRKMDCVYFGRVSGVQGRRLQQEKR